jgi:hypothetical protein
MESTVAEASTRHRPSRYHRQCDRAASVITSEEPEELKPNHVKYVAAEGQGTGSTDEPGTQIARILAAKKMEQAAENQVTDRGKGTESIPGHRGACIKAVRIPGEADPRTEHSRDSGCFAGEMGKSGRKL